jgi:hypothetical protein
MSLQQKVCHSAGGWNFFYDRQGKASPIASRGRSIVRVETKGCGEGASGKKIGDSSDRPLYKKGLPFGLLDECLC